MEIRPIHNDQDYRAALRDVSPFFDNEPEPGTLEGDRFEVMITLIEAYEAKQFPVDLPNPVDAIKFRMEQSGLSVADLVPAIGRANRVYEILNGTRSLTLPMIWKLHQMFGIPAESLIKPVKVAVSGPSQAH
jgi:HTH-type transcriptional regulator/antitoxin HigA